MSENPNHDHDQPAPDDESPSDAMSSDTLYAEVERLTSERDEAVAKYQRSLADYRNYQRRAEMNEERARVQGISSVLRDLLPALDNLDRALDQELSGEKAESMHAGVRLIKEELMKILSSHGASIIEVKTGEPFEPMRHEAMMHVESAEVEPSHVVALLQPGYEMGPLVLRPAKVSVARPPETSSDSSEEE